MILLQTFFELKDVSSTIKIGQLQAVIGDVGSGKVCLFILTLNISHRKFNLIVYDLKLFTDLFNPNTIQLYNFVLLRIIAP